MQIDKTGLDILSSFYILLKGSFWFSVSMVTTISSYVGIDKCRRNICGVHMIYHPSIARLPLGKRSSTVLLVIKDLYGV